MGIGKYGPACSVQGGYMGVSPGPDPERIERERAVAAMGGGDVGLCCACGMVTSHPKLTDGMRRCNYHMGAFAGGTIVLNSSGPVRIDAGDRLMAGTFDFEIIYSGTYKPYDQLWVTARERTARANLAAGTPMRWVSPRAGVAPLAFVSDYGLVGGLDCSPPKSAEPERYKTTKDMEMPPLLRPSPENLAACLGVVEKTQQENFRRAMLVAHGDKLRTFYGTSVCEITNEQISAWWSLYQKNVKPTPANSERACVECGTLTAQVVDPDGKVRCFGHTKMGKPPTAQRKCALEWCGRAMGDGFGMFCSTLCSDTADKRSAKFRHLRDYCNQNRPEGERVWAAEKTNEEIRALSNRFESLRHEPMRGDESIFPIVDDEE